MRSVYERDENEQLKFGSYLEDFSLSMRELCFKTKSHICEARDNIRDDAPTEAMEHMENIIDDILNQLPEIDDFGEKQKKKAKILLMRTDPFKK